eukprot:INCI2759.1.p1 GENE.INCI2759.1~~INCI2759.1.p1  ORF type:complete len:410 (-),score=77.27 INCI2759.1:1564-2793(-)
MSHDVKRFSTQKVHPAAAPSTSPVHSAGLVKFPSMNSRRVSKLGSKKCACFPTCSNGARPWLWSLMDEPNKSPAGRVVSIVILILILISCTAFCVETLPEYHRQGGLETDVWDYIEYVCTTVFTLEYILRVATTPNYKSFFLSFMNTVDLFAILPFYIELAFLASSTDAADDGVLLDLESFRILRLLRVFRVFKIARYLTWVDMFLVAMKNSLSALLMLLFIIVIAMVTFSAFMYYAERGEYDVFRKFYVRVDGTKSPFQSIPECFWWCIITMTTVGYGDVFPITHVGKIIAALTSIMGIFFLAIPITVISTNFNKEYELAQRKQAELRAKMELIKNHFRLKRSGLDSLYDEIDHMVTHRATTYKNDIADMIDASRKELINEIQELVKCAYESRKDYEAMLLKAAKKTK